MEIHINGNRIPFLVFMEKGLYDENKKYNCFISRKLEEFDQDERPNIVPMMLKESGRLLPDTSISTLIQLFQLRTYKSFNDIDWNWNIKWVEVQEE
jgi:hypothetical protein